MADEENRINSDLFGENAAKPLFSAEDESHPVAKPLFDNGLSEQGDVAFVKPLFAEPQQPVSAEAEPVFQADPVSEEPEFLQEETAQSMPESAAEEAVPQEAVPAEEMSGPEPETAAEEERKPERIGPVGPVHLSGDLESMSLGTLMRLARETAGLSQDDVYRGTKINARYLDAIENDRFEDLPHGAFPSAYVRALNALYHLDPAAKEISQRKAVAYCTKSSLPETIYEELPKNDMMINKGEMVKFRKWFIIAVTFFAFLIAISILLVVTFSMKKNDTVQTETSPVTMESLESLSGPRMPAMRKLSVPGK